MCGINGILGKFDLNQSRQCVESMNRKMAHRGPDADGVYQGGNITLGHRRLSIIDLDERGNQPMLSDDARWITGAVVPVDGGFRLDSVNYFMKPKNICL